MFTIHENYVFIVSEVSAMDMMKYAIPKYILADDIREVRKSLGLTQAEFANLLGCSKPTVVRWETSKENITGPIVCAIYAIKNDAEFREKIVLPKMKYGLRLNYMYKNELCTVIDVDELNERVEIYNYIDNIFFRAFGSNSRPTYQEYQEFIESRCFPRTRDKMKLILRDLNLPFYDPIMIIEKTEGRMAEDDFWIKLERV